MKINRAIIIGGGSSIRENRWNISIDKIPLWSALKNEFTIGTNFTFNWFNSTILMYADYQFYATQKKHLNKISLILGKQDGYYKRKNSVSKGNNVILLKECESKKYVKWNEQNESMHPYYWGKEAWDKGFYCSQLIGIKALNLAIALECKEIFLLGFDATDINGHTHFYDDTDIGTYVWNNMKQCGVGKDDRGKFNTGTYNKIEELNNFWFKPFEQELDNGIKIYNVSLNSKIDNFPKISYQKFYQKLEENKYFVNHEDIRTEIKDRL